MIQFRETNSEKLAILIKSENELTIKKHWRKENAKEIYHVGK
jgi:hypothetical protein